MSGLSEVIPIAYLIAMVLFVLGIKRLGRVKTARGANVLSAIGMGIAIGAALLDPALAGKLNYTYMAVGGLLGSAVGVWIARTVPMTSMPEMVGLLNGSGGLASLLVALAVLWETRDNHWATEPGITLARALSNNPLVGSGPFVALTLALSIIIGAITFTGSLVAYGKLAGKISGNSIQFGGQHALNGVLGAAALGLSAYLCYGPAAPEHMPWLALALTVISLLLGVLLVIPIGGADMPVVISLLNSYSGIAAGMTGFVLSNNVLIVTGALVGASGIILTDIMCKAMNRSLVSVLMGGFGATAGTATASKGGKDEYKNIKSMSAEDLALLLDGVSSVIFVPGYGLAVSQAQHVTRELSDYLQQKKNITVRYAIHPVAGRMPGHMNVLLAESNVPYEQLVEMDTINPDFKTTDLVIVLGANDVVNPAALNDPTSPLAGMPILNCHEARNVVVVKRSLSPGYAGVKNTLFEYDNCRMLFDDAKGALQTTLAELKANG